MTHVTGNSMVCNGRNVEACQGAPYGFVAIADDMIPKPMLLPIQLPVIRKRLLDTVVSTCAAQLA